VGLIVPDDINERLREKIVQVVSGGALIFHMRKQTSSIEEFQ